MICRRHACLGKGIQATLQGSSNHRISMVHENLRLEQMLRETQVSLKLVQHRSNPKTDGMHNGRSVAKGDAEPFHVFPA